MSVNGDTSTAVLSTPVLGPKERHIESSCRRWYEEYAVVQRVCVIVESWIGARKQVVFLLKNARAGAGAKENVSARSTLRVYIF